MRRMDRYGEESTNRVSRTDKNKDIYENYTMNPVYTNLSDVTNSNAYEINPNTSIDSHTTREAYQKLREYQNVELPKEKKELEDVNYLSKRQENKVYDINSVLENARKNRESVDELDEKRKLKNNAYNILSGKNRKQLEKYREERAKRLATPEEEELRELIDTIASKTLAGEIDKATSVDLLSDLMATNMLDVVEGSGELEQITTTHEITSVDGEVVDEKIKVTKEEFDTDEIKDTSTSGYSDTSDIDIKEAEVKEDKNSKTQQIDKIKDPDFYTRSMDLSDKDFDMSDDFKEDKVPIGLKILIFLLVIIIVGIAAYIIHQRFM